MTARNRLNNPVARVIAAVSAAIAGACWIGGCSSEPDGLIVYCAHDQQFSEQILRRFEKETGIRVIPRFDTEATKSLGLTNLLISEKDHPRCDVFWNNQVLGTADLKRHGILLPYKGPGYERIPARYKDPEGDWTGFAARLRVYIVNTEALPAVSRDPEGSALPDEAEIERRFAADDLSRIAVAKPLFGTTLSHYTVLWQLWKPDGLKKWQAATRERGIREVAGNSTVMNLVAGGTCDLGWTDTDDFFVAKDRGDPVSMLPIRVTVPNSFNGERAPTTGGSGSATASRATICIPNSVAIIKGTHKLEQAQRLVDFLLSAQTELELARSQSRQIPLGPVDDEAVPADVRPLRQWAREGFDLTDLVPARVECLEWLSSEYLR